MYWAAIRLLLMFFLFFALRESLLSSALTPAFVLPAVVVWLERRRSHETLLQANLGVREVWFWILALPLGLVLDGLATALLWPFL